MSEVVVMASRGIMVENVLHRYGATVTLPTAEALRLHAYGLVRVVRMGAPLQDNAADGHQDAAPG